MQNALGSGLNNLIENEDFLTHLNKYNVIHLDISSFTDFYKDNLHYTSQALQAIGDIGGPRCCKRNAFLSIQTGIAFVKERYGIELELHPIICEFSCYNQQCIKERCPFYQKEI